MPWVKFDDQFPIHRKVAGLSDSAYILHIDAIFWSARNLTDGVIPKDDIKQICTRGRNPLHRAAECVIRAVWHLADEPCESDECPAPVEADGWVIHDYWRYQPRKAHVVATRRTRAEAGRKGGVASGQSRRKPEAKMKQVASSLLNPRPVPVVTADVVNRPNGSSGARASPELIEAIIKEILDVTGKHIDDAWAARIAAEIFKTSGSVITHPVAYARQVIRNDPNPRTRFLPLYPDRP